MRVIKIYVDRLYNMAGNFAFAFSYLAQYLMCYKKKISTSFNIGRC